MALPKKLTFSEDNRHMYNINYIRQVMMRSHQRVKQSVANHREGRWICIRVLKRVKV